MNSAWVAAGFALASMTGTEPVPPPPTASYWVYVANESSDLVSRVRFGPDGLVEEKTIRAGGLRPDELSGPHGLTVSPNGKEWFVSLAHGLPYGQIWKLETGTDRFLDSTTVGLFPATMAVTPDGSTLYVVNFNLHGDMVPSSVSVVFTPLLGEQRKVETCLMPHGGRITHDGRFHYSACMMSDQLVEIATGRNAVSRRLSLAPGHEGVMAGDPQGHMTMGPPGCKPTWVAISPDDRLLYVPCNGRKEVLEIDRASLAITRRLPTGAGPYNATVSADGKWLVVTLKSNQAAALFDLASGTETRVPTTQPITHGVVVTPDSRYAFITNEAIGATRSTLDVIDLSTRTVVASVQLQYQAGGIGFWKMERPVKP